MTGTDVVRLEGIVKTFPGVRAVDGIDFAARSGEVHAIVGENGAGKTTLMRVLGGLARPDAGTLTVDGAPVHFRSALGAARAGIGMVHQHFTLVPVFTVLENVALGREPKWFGGLSVLRDRVRAAAERLSFRVDPDAVVADLSVGEKQYVEILRHLIHGARILILDEPTDVLTPIEARDLYRVLRDLADEGRTVLFISHRLPEVLGASDRVTVMRKGQKVSTVVTAETNERELARLMVGREILGAGGGRDVAVVGPVRLSATNLHARSDRGRPALRGVDLSVRGGEVLGIAGVTGNGQKELFETILGLRAPGKDGRVRIDDRDATRWPVRRRLDAGVSFVPEDRNDSGLVLSLSAEENLELGRRGARGWGISRQKMRDRARSALADYDVRPPDASLAADAFSGGNQQKIVLARALSGGPGILLLAEPTRGLDVGAAETIHGKIREVRDDGAAVVVASSDVTELLSLADRIVVLSRGRISGEVVPGRTTEAELGLMMSGGAA